MITAAKSPVGGWLVWQLIRSAITKHFSAVHARQTSPTQNTPVTLPTIYYVNHSNWWDGYMCMALVQQVFEQDSYLMMEERNLRRYRFFTWVGVFGVDRDDGRAALASLDYAASILRGHPERGMYMFPQGTMVPNERRPLEFYSGLARLARRVGDVRLVPVAIRYEFLQEQRPEAFLSIGPARNITIEDVPSPRQLTAELHARLTSELEALTSDVIAERLSDFTTIMRGRGGIDRTLDRLLLRGRRRSRRLGKEG